ncbi:MAG TPA: hypothetical protein VJQ59_16755 [Candidatus Sulfotelmatobacter sp.]|nr:hypothetical protein [Candidatus Sulfotelmatobacter sp.]
MALQQITLTMTGSAVQLTTTRTPFHYMRIESEASNAIVYYGTSAVTTSSYAGTVLANTTTINNGVVVGPFPQLPSNASEFWFIGTNSQKIHVTLVT